MKTIAMHKAQNTIVCLCIFALALSVKADEIVFTGAATAASYEGETDPWRNLTNPTNYSGNVLPTAHDTIVIDCSGKSTLASYGKNAYSHPYIRNNLEVKGIRIKNYSAVFYLATYNRNAVLSIGSDGIEMESVGGLNVGCQVETTADQTWKSTNNTRFEMNNKILGSGKTLTFGTGEKGNGYIVFQVAPEYDGTFVFAIDNFVAYQRNAKWANVIRYSGSIDATKQKIVFEPFEDLVWETIFPEKRSYSWQADYIRQFEVGYRTNGDPTADNKVPPYGRIGKYKLTVSDSTFTTSQAGMMAPCSGILVLSGNADWQTSNVYTYIGPADGNPSRYDGYAKCQVEGNAKLSSIFINIGYWGRWSEGGERFLDQIGGTVEGTYGVNVGGNPSKHNNASNYPPSNPSPWNEYVLGAGTFKAEKVHSANWDKIKEGTGQSNAGLGICSQEQETLNGGNKPTSAGVFTMTGGVANVGGVHFGVYRKGWWSDGEPYGIGDGFGAFYLGGGTFNLGKNGFYLGSGWNGSTADESNSVYRVSLGGGRLVTSVAQTNGLSVCFPPTGRAAELSLGALFRQAGPIHGNGTLKKTGAGTLAISDASRFTGSLQVDEGTVSLDYAPSADVETVESDCVCFRADDLTTLADGAEVSSWPSSDGKFAAGVAPTGKNVINPLYKSNAFNGHAGVMFRTNIVNGTAFGSALAIPTASNPLIGSEDHTIVVVYRPDNFDGRTTFIGQGNPSAENVGNQIYYSQGIIGNVTPTDCGVGIFLMASGRPALCENFFGAGLYADIGYRIVDRAYVSEKGKVSVAIGTLSGSVFTLNVDGEEWSNEYEAVKTAMASGKTFKRFYTQDQRKANSKPFYFGHTGRADATDWGACFKGYIAEVRIYPKRALTELERKSLALALLAKYDETSLARQNDIIRNDTVEGSFAAATVPSVPTGATALDATALIAEGSVIAGSPTRVTGGINGYDIVRFGGADALSLPSTKTPVAGKTSFTVAVVYKTTTEGTGENGYAIGSGLVSTWQGGATDADYAVSFRRFGAVGAGTGNSTGAQFCNDVKPARLDDGLAHVSVFAVDSATKKMHTMTDGRLVTKDFFSTTTTFDERGDYETVVGALTKTTGFFTGDIAEVVFYDHALTADEMTQFSEAMAGKYAFRLLDKDEHTSVVSSGLGAKSISVAAGATLRLPQNAKAQVTIGTNSSIFVAGTITGSLCLGDGAVYDAAKLTGHIDDLQLQNAIFKASTTTSVAIGSKLSGTAKLVFEGTWPDGIPPAKQVFATFDRIEDVQDVVWTCDEPRFRRVQIDAVNRRLIARFESGLYLIVK